MPAALPRFFQHLLQRLRHGLRRRRLALLQQRQLAAAARRNRSNFLEGLEGRVMPSGVVSIIATDAISTEAAGNSGLFTVSRTGETTAALVIQLNIAGTATNGADYETIPATLTIAIGQSSATIAVSPSNDAIAEGNETVSIAIAPDVNYEVNAAQSVATVTITDDEPTISIQATDTSASEPGTDTGVWTVTRTGATTSALTINYSISGTAGNGSDYVSLPGTLTIAAGQATNTIRLLPLDDLLAEGAQTVTLTLSSNAAYSIDATKATSTISILDNEAVVSIQATDSAAAEPGTNTGVFTVTRTGATTSALTVNYTVSGTATTGSDFTALTGTVTIAAGQTTATITLTPLDDAVVEGQETVIVTLTATAGYSVDPTKPSATVTVQDDDTSTISLSAQDDTAAEIGLQSGVFRFSRTGVLTQAVTVNYVISGVASNGIDYQLITNSVTLAAGQSSATVRVSPLADVLVEGTETVVLTLASGLYNIDATKQTATVRIADAQKPTLSITAADASSSEAGASRTGRFTVTRAGLTDADLTVNLTIAGTATNGTDYTTIAATVVIPAGQDSVDIVVDPTADTALEGNETVKITLATSSNYEIASNANNATVNIADEQKPLLSITATDNAAAEAGSATGAFTITRTGPTTLALTVTLRITGRARNGRDYQTIARTVTIAAGQASATVTITPIVDPIREGNETLTLRLLPQRNSYLIDAEHAADLVTIADQEPIPAIEVLGRGVALTRDDSTPSTDDNTDLGTTAVGLAVVRTFTIRDTGVGFLRLLGRRVMISGAGAGQFYIRRMPAARVAPGHYTQFQLVFRPRAAGVHEAQVTILSDDPTAAAFSFTVRGTATA